MRSLSQIVHNLRWRMIDYAPIRYRLNMRCMMLSSSRRSFESEWHLLEKLGDNRGLALDVGANRGFFSWRLSRLYDKVLAFEPNVAVSRELAAAGLPNLELRSVALSSRSGSKNLYIPKNASGDELDGWASFDQNNFADAKSARTIEVPITALDDSTFDSLRFIKVDVEGHEVDFLKGAIESLRIHKPNVLIEVRDSTLPEVLRIFADLNFRQLDLSARLGTPAGEGMYLFGYQDSATV